MKRSHPSLNFLFSGAAATSVVLKRITITMSSQPAYRGGRNQWRRQLSDSAENSESGHLVSGDSHFRSVKDTNQGYRSVERGNFISHNNTFRPNPSAAPFNPRHTYNENQQQFNQNQRFRPQGGPHLYQNQQHFNQNQRFRPQGGPHLYQNQQFRPPPPRVSDYRGWEYAKLRPPPDCERFTVLSYNILADYLALNHRNQLYFHIPHYILEWEFRKRNIVSELGWWSADILCFQEVDRFHDLEGELKVRGYCGLWKMRTGDPVDGCAIFWRTSRFKLLHQEYIEFNKLGLRDNVALICVLESMRLNDGGCSSSPHESSIGANKIVVCNIHVLYNPRRGEIKLGQVRGLLNKAYEVSQLWNNAPVVVCGDFNCTPKSPLYNFIAEQKLNVTELPRDKLSGQASAEIPPPQPYNPNPRPYSGPQPSVDEKEVEQNNASLVMQIPESSDINLEKTPCNSLDQSVTASPSSSIKGQHDQGNNVLSHETMKNDLQSEEDVCKDETELTLKSLDINLEKTPCSSLDQPITASPSSSIEGQHDHGNNVLSHETMKKDLQCKEEIWKDETELTLNCKVSGSNGSPSTYSSEEGDINPDIVARIGEEAQASSIVSFGEHSETSCLEKEKVNSDMSMGDNCSTDATTTDSPGKASNFDGILREQSDATSPVSVIEASPIDTPKNLLFVTVADDLSGTDHETLNTERTPYDPSAWTPMEIEKATGSSECTFVEHPIKLSSTYTEVEDRSGTRNSTGEPQVTSYHRRFSGTVDYIWRSEGLQTVRVLAPMPKQAMQWTPGFPTKKWGSDHIALVTELAFIKDDTQDSLVR